MDWSQSVQGVSTSGTERCPIRFAFYPADMAANFAPWFSALLPHVIPVAFSASPRLAWIIGLIDANATKPNPSLTKFLEERPNPGVFSVRRTFLSN